MSRRCNQNACFTLIEMLVVMAIVGILAALVGSAMVMARREAVRMECAENLHQVGTLLQSMLLSDGNEYPALYEKQNGDIPSLSEWEDLTPPAPHDPHEGIPWWARVYEASAGAARLDVDDSTPDVLDLPNQIPKSMKLFHCRAAPPLDNRNVLALDHSISYGLNFDVMRDDGTQYQCVSKTIPPGVPNPLYPNLDAANGTAPTGAPDRKPDRLRWGDIKNPAEFILVSEADAENETDPLTTDPTGGRIRCKETQTSDDSDRAPIVARHGGKANVLFADNHVELIEVTVDDMHGPEDVNQMTPLWTLPDD